MPIELTVNLVLDPSSSSNHVGGIMRSILLNELLRLEAIKEQANFIKKLKGILQIINKGGDGDDQRNAEAAATNLSPSTNAKMFPLQ